VGELKDGLRLDLRLHPHVHLSPCESPEHAQPTQTRQLL
jgi:hypothetical protein